MPTIRIGLLWHSANSGNLGVGALTIANMAIIRGVAAELGLTPEFLIMGMRDEDPDYVAAGDAPRFDIDTRRLISPSGCWKRLGEQHCVIDIGGGDSFTDIYGAKRLSFLWATKAMAIAQRRPLLLAPQTIGPFRHPLSRRLAAGVLERSAAVLTRDELSLQAVTAIAPRARVRLATDVAFALPYVDRSPTRSPDKLKVGVNVSGLLYGEATSGRNRFGLGFDYAKFSRDLLAALISRADVEVHLVDHVAPGAGGPDDDRRTSAELAAAYPTAVRRPTRFASPSEAKSYISGLDFLVAARMHACIAAFSAGTPVAPIAYSRKFEGLFGALDYQWSVRPEARTSEDVLSFVLDCLRRREQLAQDIQRSLPRVDALLDEYRDALRSFLRASLA